MESSAPTPINRVAASGLITLRLEDWLSDTPVVDFDLADYLFQGLVLREKPFRQALREQDWTDWSDQVLAIHCSTDAIIPLWAYVLVAAQAQPQVKEVFYGSAVAWRQARLLQHIKDLDVTPYKDQRVIIKGCNREEISPAAYIALAARLQPQVKSLMFGEPCSTVPIYKRR